MRLFEAILDANHRAVAGDPSAGVRVADYVAELPVIALTCIDPRLNRLFPGVLGLPEEHFIWLRNAGNIITGPLSSTMRSIAVACAVKGGRDIAVIGHTDCKISHVTISELTDLFKALGVERQRLPENLTDYFGVFASERQNVIRGVDFVRQSPLIGPRIPVHGLMVDIQSGLLEWIVNGYETLERSATPPVPLSLPSLGAAVENLAARAAFDLGEMKFPESKIGDMASAAIQTLSVRDPASDPRAPIAPPVAPPPPPSPPPLAPPAAPPPLHPRAVPIPPPIRLHPRGRTGRQPPLPGGFSNR
jgi:carbonic anhydrase